MPSSSDSRFPHPLRLSRRKFMVASGMLPLIGGVPGGSASVHFDQSTVGMAGAPAPDDAAFPDYPGALVGFMCAPDDAKRDNGSPPPPWALDIPVGWLETTMTAAYEAGGKAGGGDIASVEVLLDGKPIGRLQPLDSRGSNSLVTGWLRLGFVGKGTHQFALAFNAEADLKLAGAWVTNGPLSYWPGNPMVLAADQNFWPGNLRLVPRPVDTQLPLEYGRQGLASHINEQGMFGIADSRMTGVGRSLRLRYSDAELNVMVETPEGPRRAMELCPDFHFQLLDGYLPCPVAHFTLEQVRYAVTFAAIPEAGEAADLVHVAAWNDSSEPRPNRVGLWLDAAADVEAQGTTVTASGEIAALSGGNCHARLRTRTIGCVDPRAQPVGIFLTPYLDPASMEWDSALYSARVSWGKEPVRYLLHCPPGEHYTVYLGVIKLPRFGNTWSASSGIKQVSILSVEGAKEVRVDANDLAAPALFQFDAGDDNRHGVIEIRSSPPAEIDRAVATLASIWVFPAGASVDMELLRRGKLPTAPLHHVNVGGTGVSWYIDTVAGEDWSSAYVDISSEHLIPAGGKEEFWAALPVNHRGEVFPGGGARAWREADEGTPAYAARVQKRLAAAELASSSPAKALDKVRAYWATVLQTPTRLAPPETSVRDVARTSHCYFHILRYPLANDCAVPMGGDCLDYYDFSERDSAYELVGLDETGRHDQAESFLNIYLAHKGELKNARWPLGQESKIPTEPRRGT